MSSNTTRRRHHACISDKEEGSTDAKDANEINTADTDNDTAANNAAPNDDNYAIMPPKVKPPSRKPSIKKTKGESDDVAVMPFPPPPSLQ
jgi:hypothetical protein